MGTRLPDEDRERGGEARAVEVAQHLADERGSEEQAVDACARRGTLERHPEPRHARHRERDPGGPRRLQEGRHRDQGAGEERQRLLRVAVHLHHLRHHVDEECAHHQQRDAGHDGGIHQRECQSPAQLLAFLEVVGELRQHARQLAGGFARGDERAVELRKHARERAQRLGDGGSGHDLAAQCREHLPLALHFRLLDERVERLLDGEAGLDQRGEAAREAREFGRREGHRAEARAAGRIVGGDDLDPVRGEALVAQGRACLAGAVGLQHALVQPAFERISLVAEAWHGAPGRGARSSSPATLRRARSCRRAPSAARPRAAASCPCRPPSRGCRARPRCRARGGARRRRR